MHCRKQFDRGTRRPRAVTGLTERTGSVGSDRPVFPPSVYERAEITGALSRTGDFFFPFFFSPPFLQESLHLATFTIHKRFRYQRRRSLIYNEEAATEARSTPYRVVIDSKFMIIELRSSARIDQGPLSTAAIFLCNRCPPIGSVKRDRIIDQSGHRPRLNVSIRSLASVRPLNEDGSRSSIVQSGNSLKRRQFLCRATCFLCRIYGRIPGLIKTRGQS